MVGFFCRGSSRSTPASPRSWSAILADNLQWHRRSELERYSAFLREMAAPSETRRRSRGLVPASRRTEEYWREVFEQAAPGYAAIAATFTDAQVEELLASLERVDDKERREFASRSPAERDARREKSVRRALERFTGPLTTPQRALVRAHVAGSPSFVPEWLDNRRVWRAALAEALALRHRRAEFDARMQVLVARPDDLWTPQYRAAVERRRDALVELMTGLDATLTPEQRAAARRELLALADEVQDLARRRG